MTPAKVKANAAHRQRLYDEGRCVRCGRTRETDTKRCQRCTAKAAEAAWQRRQTQEPARRGPAPTIVGWNYETDDLIAQHMKLARCLAWRIAAKRCSTTADIDDMVGDALYGLVVAGRTYDASYNVPFGAWATKRIKGAVHDGLNRWSKRKHKQPPVFVPLEDDAE